MVASIAGFHTRADLRLRAPRSISRNVQPGQGGVAVHYGGGPHGADREHAHHVNVWRNWQAFHMDSRGWADIAYTGGFCNCGYAFAGRGAGIRTGANGTNFGNQYFYAVTWIGGEGEHPSPKAINALEWWVNELRTAGGAASQVVPHRHFKATGCPGHHLVSEAARLNRAPISLALQEDDSEMLALIIAIYEKHGHNWQGDANGVDFWSRHGAAVGVRQLIIDMLGAIYAAAAKR